MRKFLVVSMLGLSLTACKDMGNGEKVGQIVKLSKYGFFCKTYEAQIIRGGLNNGSGASGLAFDFTIEDEKLVPAVQAALDSQTEVKIHYNTEAATACRSESGDHFLQSIVPLHAGHALEIAK